MVAGRSAHPWGDALTATVLVRRLALCRLEELPDGGSLGFDPFTTGHDTLLVIRRGKFLYGWLDSCPHISGVPMAWRKNAYLNAARDKIVCSAHGALFDITTGLCTLGPCLGQFLQAASVSLGEDGLVYLDEAP